MKNFSRILIGFFVLAVLSSCESIGIGGKKMDSQEAAELVVKTYQKYVDTENYKPVEIVWSEREELSNKMELLYLTMVGKADGKLYTQLIKVGGDYRGPAEIKASSSSSTYDFETVKWIAESDIKPEIVLNQINNAKAELPEEFNFKAVGRYSLSVDPETGEKNVVFNVLVTEKGNATSVQGRNIVTTYYEVEFYGMEDGTAVMEEIDEE